MVRVRLALGVSIGIVIGSGFWRFTGVVFSLFWLLVGVTVLGLRVFGTPSAVLPLGNPCVLPCLFGVIPGETPRDQAVLMLAGYALVNRIADEPLIFSLPDAQNRTLLVSVFSDPDGVVESLRLNAPPLLADLLLAGHQPSRVFRTCADMTPVRLLIVFGEREELFAEFFPRGRVTPATRPSLFESAAAGEKSLYDARLSFGCSVETRWMGFAALWKYFRTEPA